VDLTVACRPTRRASRGGDDLVCNGPTDDKKNLLQPHVHKCWVIPPEHNAAFVAPMEDVLELSQRPSDPRHSLVTMDEKPGQLIQATRTPLPAKPGKPSRYDYADERVGTATVFLFTEPLTGWRTIDISAQRTAVDWAHQIKHLLDDGYPEADKIILVCDNLNTHKLASLYEAFEPQEARRLAQRLEIHYTPKHGSWLNIAEIELSVRTKQCLDRRIAAIETLQQETKVWEHERNAKQTGVDWQFTTEDARIRLKRLYPQYQD
jgi:DDE superfamily endonuclease